MGSLSVQPLTRSIGAQVDDLRLADASDQALASVVDALHEHQVLFFRGQHLSDDEHLALVKALGEPMVFPVDELTGSTNPLYWIEDSAEHPPDSDNWHTDITWWPEPPKYGTLCAIDIPAAGGDTLWSSLYAAYDALSEPMQAWCDQLAAWHEPGQRFLDAYVRIHGPEIGSTIVEHCTGAEHPLVRTNEDTGRKALFLSYFLDHIIGIHRAESDHLLAYLDALVTDPNRCVRWRWQAGDVVLWDERSTEHRALADHYPAHRLMRRCTVQGPRPR